MEKYSFKPKGVCAILIQYELDDEKKIHNLSFVGGCNGNLKAIGKLVEGKPASEIADILRGNECGGRGTSCADQLAKALDEALGR